VAKTRLTVAQLDEARLAEVRALEQELGLYLVALEHKIEFANLSKEQLERVQAKEQDLGVVLVAYESK